MFKLALKPSYSVQVSGTLPGGNKVSFEIEFNRLSQDEIAAVAKGNDSGDIIYAEICRQVVTGWKSVQDEEGNVLDFSPAALEQMLAIYPMSKIIFDTWQSSMTEARGKN